MIRAASLCCATHVFALLAWPVFEKLDASRRPGDITIGLGTENLTIPFVSSLILTAVVGAAFRVLKR